MTILNRAANPTGAAALVRYLLNAQRKFTLKKNGLVTLKPQFSGRKSRRARRACASWSARRAEVIARARSPLPWLGGLLALYLLAPIVAFVAAPAPWRLGLARESARRSPPRC